MQETSGLFSFKMRLSYLKRFKILFIFLGCLWFIFYTVNMNSCLPRDTSRLHLPDENIYSKTENELKGKILILSESRIKSNNTNDIIRLIESNRFSYKHILFNPNKINYYLINGTYKVIIFDDINIQKRLNKSQVESLNKYCSMNQIGIIIFIKPYNNLSFNASLNTQLKSFYNITKQTNKKIEFNSCKASPIKDKTIKPILSTSRKEIIVGLDDSQTRKIYFGSYVQSKFILKLLFIDSIKYASFNTIYNSLDRYIQIDIDDVFIDAFGVRMNYTDVLELISLQNQLNRYYFGSNNKFKFNLGYSGYYYQENNKADNFLIQMKYKFNWFDHMWSHLKPHILNESLLGDSLRKNLKFALQHGLSINNSYAVSPHHSG